MTPRDRLLKYAQNEVKLASQCLEQSPEDATAKDRLAYWSAKLGNFDIEAGTEKGQAIVDELKRQWQSNQ